MILFSAFSFLFQNIFFDRAFFRESKIETKHLKWKKKDETKMAHVKTLPCEEKEKETFGTFSFLAESAILNIWLVLVLEEGERLPLPELLVDGVDDHQKDEEGKEHAHRDR